MRGLSESEAPQAAMEIPCAWRVWSPRKGKRCFSEQRTAGAGAWEQTPARVGLARVL